MTSTSNGILMSTKNGEAKKGTVKPSRARDLLEETPIRDASFCKESHFS